MTGPSDVSRPQDLDPRYVAARRVLLDALTVLAPHGDAVILAGAQAVYLHTGAADLAIAPYTTDGDLVLDPLLLGEAPELRSRDVRRRVPNLQLAARRPRRARHLAGERLSCRGGDPGSGRSHRPRGRRVGHRADAPHASAATALALLGARSDSRQHWWTTAR